MSELNSLNLDDLSYKELRAHAKRNSLSAAGKKVELISRLSTFRESMLLNDNGRQSVLSDLGTENTWTEVSSPVPPAKPPKPAKYLSLSPKRDRGEGKDKENTPQPAVVVFKTTENTTFEEGEEEEEEEEEEERNTNTNDETFVVDDDEEEEEDEGDEDYFDDHDSDYDSDNDITMAMDDKQGGVLPSPPPRGSSILSASFHQETDESFDMLTANEGLESEDDEEKEETIIQEQDSSASMLNDDDDEGGGGGEEDDDDDDDDEGGEEEDEEEEFVAEESGEQAYLYSEEVVRQSTGSRKNDSDDHKMMETIDVSEEVEVKEKNEEETEVIADEEEEEEKKEGNDVAEEHVQSSGDIQVEETLASDLHEKESSGSDVDMQHVTTLTRSMDERPITGTGAQGKGVTMITPDEFFDRYDKMRKMRRFTLEQFMDSVNIQDITLEMLDEQMKIYMTQVEDLGILDNANSPSSNQSNKEKRRNSVLDIMKDHGVEPGPLAMQLLDIDMNDPRPLQEIFPTEQLQQGALFNSGDIESPKKGSAGKKKKKTPGARKSGSSSGSKRKSSSGSSGKGKRKSSNSTGSRNSGTTKARPAIDDDIEHAFDRLSLNHSASKVTPTTNKNKRSPATSMSKNSSVSKALYSTTTSSLASLMNSPGGQTFASKNNQVTGVRMTAAASQRYQATHKNRDEVAHNSKMTFMERIISENNAAHPEGITEYVHRLVQNKNNAFPLPECQVERQQKLARAREARLLQARFEYFESHPHFLAKIGHPNATIDPKTGEIIVNEGDSGEVDESIVNVFDNGNTPSSHNTSHRNNNTNGHSSTNGEKEKAPKGTHNSTRNTVAANFKNANKVMKGSTTSTTTTHTTAKVSMYTHARKTTTTTTTARSNTSSGYGSTTTAKPVTTGTNTRVAAPSISNRTAKTVTKAPSPKKVSQPAVNPFQAML